MLGLGPSRVRTLGLGFGLVVGVTHINLIIRVSWLGLELRLGFGLELGLSRVTVRVRVRVTNRVKGQG